MGCFGSISKGETGWLNFYKSGDTVHFDYLRDFFGYSFGDYTTSRI